MTLTMCHGYPHALVVAELAPRNGGAHCCDDGDPGEHLYELQSNRVNCYCTWCADARRDHGREESRPPSGNFAGG